MIAPSKTPYERLSRVAREPEFWPLQSFQQVNTELAFDCLLGSC